MAGSKVEIWNLALGHLKADNSVQTENENSFEAEQCRIFYDPCRRRVLRDHAWTFAQTRRVLALTGTAPEGWDFSYGYPSDCLTAQHLFNPLDPKNNKLPPLEFEIAPDPVASGKLIWTDVEDACLVFTIDVDVTSQSPQYAQSRSMSIRGDQFSPSRVHHVLDGKLS